MPTSSSSTSRSSTRRTSASSIRSSALRRLAAASLIAALGGLAPAAQAQVRVQAGGRVLRATATDSVPLPGLKVVLHRVGRLEQGPVDSTLTDTAGRFHFGFLADTAAIYLVSARHAGIVYFGPPVHTNPIRPDTAITLAVADTSSDAPVNLDARHIVVSAPAADGTRSVVEVVILHNDGPLTRVGRDSTQPVWAERIPAAAVGLTAGEGDLAPEAIGRLGDSVVVRAPISTGEKQIVIQYTIPAGVPRLDYHFDAPVPLVNLMVEEPGATVDGGLTQQADSERIQGRPFRRWQGRVPAGGVVSIRLPRPRQVARWALRGLIALVLLGLAVGALRVFRAPVAARVPPPSPDALLNTLARLDATYDGREAEVPPDEWARYVDERARLKAALTDALAARRSAT